MDTRGKLIPLKQVLGNNSIKCVLNVANTIIYMYSVTQVASIKYEHFHTYCSHLTVALNISMCTILCTVEVQGSNLGAKTGHFRRHFGGYLRQRPTWISLALFYNTFIIILCMFRALCAHHQEDELYWCSIWYRPLSQWPSGAQVDRERMIQGRSVAEKQFPFL